MSEQPQEKLPHRSVLHNFGIARALAARPVLSLVVGLAFLALAVSFYTGHGPGGRYQSATRGELLVMTLSCLVIGGYFLNATVRAWRRRS
jgi:hypothetical protein